MKSSRIKLSKFGTFCTEMWSWKSHGHLVKVVALRTWTLWVLQTHMMAFQNRYSNDDMAWTQLKVNLSLRLFVYGKQPSYSSHFVVCFKSSEAVFVGFPRTEGWLEIFRLVFVPFFCKSDKITQKKVMSVHQTKSFIRRRRPYDGRIVCNMKDVWSKEWNGEIIQSCYLQR